MRTAVNLHTLEPKKKRSLQISYFTKSRPSIDVTVKRHCRHVGYPEIICRPGKPAAGRIMGKAFKFDYQQEEILNHVTDITRPSTPKIMPFLR